jgi:hypothetical protein
MLPGAMPTSPDRRHGARRREVRPLLLRAQALPRSLGPRAPAFASVSMSMGVAMHGAPTSASACRERREG